MSFSENLKNELLFRDIQFKKFSKSIDIPYTTLSSYINQNILPNVETAYKIAKKLNVSIEYLITGDENDNFCKKNRLLKEFNCLTLAEQKLIIQLIHILYENTKNNKEEGIYE